MIAQLIDEKAIAQKVRDEVAAAGKMQPTMATVLIGDRPDSAVYVASKGKPARNNTKDDPMNLWQKYLRPKSVEEALAGLVSAK